MTKRFDRSCLSGSIFYLFIFSVISSCCKPGFVLSDFAAHFEIFFEDKLLPSPSFSLSVSKTRTGPYFWRGYPLWERKILLCFHVLLVTSDSRFERGGEMQNGLWKLLSLRKKRWQNVSAWPKLHLWEFFFESFLFSAISTFWKLSFFFEAYLDYLGRQAPSLSLFLVESR